MTGKPREIAKDRSAAEIQITAEQLLRDAKEKQDTEPADPRRKISDKEELQEYCFEQRRKFENAIRNQRQHIGNFLKYAAWEESQHEFDRARSIYERAIEVDYKNTLIWLRYASMEMKHKYINRARTVYERAITLLPRVEQFWYKFTYLEEMLGNYANARNIFDRWMEWTSSEQAWLTYINFELRNGNENNARKVYERYITQYPSETSFIRYAKWEERQDQKALARRVFERSLQVLVKDEITEKLYLEFAKFEIRCQEIERARVIFKYGLENIPKEQCQELDKEFGLFEKQYGDSNEIESLLITKKREEYESILTQNPYNYDTWFDYIHLEEEYGEISKIRDVYERSIANIPPKKEKRYWRRYIYLWINYAVFEELIAEDIDRAREVYKQCLQVIPNKIFTFAKIWIMYAKFEIRQNDLPQARKILGRAIGMCPKPKLFREYINIERQLFNIDRCRLIYNKFVETINYSVDVWISYAQFEYELEEYERMRAIFELAISQEVLDKPEYLWKKYIDIEIELDEDDGDKVRDLYSRLLERSKHPKIYISYAKFERSKNISNGRQILNEGITIYKDAGDNESRAILLAALKNYEMTIEDNDKNIEDIEKRQPEKILKKQSEEEGGEEYYDYIFPDDKANNNLKLEEMAKRWKQGQFMAKRVKTEEDVDVDDI
ncbi:hypothetical protein WA158_001226 [Blastocystis sp. Blastoise]